jgi:hypothetical protein
MKGASGGAAVGSREALAGGKLWGWLELWKGGGGWRERRRCLEVGARESGGRSLTTEELWRGYFRE